MKKTDKNKEEKKQIINDLEVEVAILNEKHDKLTTTLVITVF